MKLIRTLVFLYWVLLAFIINGQSASQSFSENIRFISYLNSNGLAEDALVLLKSMDRADLLTTTQTDSIHYLIADIYYKKEQFDSAAYYFGKVKSADSLLSRSCFLQAYSYIKTDSFSLAENKLIKLQPTDSIFNELKYLQLSGIALLQRNYNAFDDHSNKFSFSKPDILAEEKKMIDHSIKLKNIKYKSPFVAGSLSAIIPGLGKLYAGKPKQGLTAFLPVAIFGLQAYEAYSKAGAKSARFVVFGSLFTVFYIGNIWGSALSVHIVNNEINEEINRQIVFDLAVPLQRIFR
jgi:hypothetical protein